MATHAHGARTPARAAPPIVLCDGPCGEAYPATMFVVVGRYAICKADVHNVRAFDERWRQADRYDHASASAARAALAEIVSAEGAYTASAHAVRRWFGLE